MAKINLIKASDGTGNASVATISTLRTAGASTILVDTTQGFPDEFCGSMGTPHTFVDPITAEEITVISEETAVDFTGHVDGSNLEIDDIAPGYTDGGSAAGDIVIIKPTTQYADNLATVLEVAHNDDGSLKDDAVTTDVIADDAVTIDKFTNELAKGWAELGIAQSGTIVHNGNRSYTFPMASDVSGFISPDMKIKGIKGTPGNAYMGGLFNGTSQYFTKVTPTGTLATITTNFTIEAVAQPMAYAFRAITGRTDAGRNNGIEMVMIDTGQVRVVIRNGGAANFKYADTWPSLALGRKTHIAAHYSAGSFSVYFDGIAVPMQAAVGGGTNPATAGTGGDFSIGRNGAYAAEYFSGYISNVAWFDAVLTQATIKQHATYKLTGGEANCIGAWSLDNTAVNQQAPGTNDLTAVGGVGYTAMSPHGQMGDAVHANEFCALVMAVTTSTMTLQVPEGITIPTSGTIGTVYYAVSGNPFGWVGNKQRWALMAVNRVTQSTNGPVAATAYNAVAFTLTYPVGSWVPTVTGVDMYTYRTAAGIVEMICNIGTSTSDKNPINQDLYLELYQDLANVTATLSIHTRSMVATQAITVASATTYYLNYWTGIVGITWIGIRGDRVPGAHSIIPAGL